MTNERWTRSGKRMAHSRACMPPSEPPSTMRKHRTPSESSSRAWARTLSRTGDEGEIGTVDAPRFWIDRAGPGGAVTGAQHVDADGEVVFEREDSAGAEDFGPPGADQRRTGERVADKDSVVACRIEATVYRIVQPLRRRGCGRTRARGARGGQSRPRRLVPRILVPAGGVPAPVRASVMTLIVQQDSRFWLRAWNLCPLAASMAPIEIGKNIADIFDADGETDELGRDAGRGLLFDLKAADGWWRAGWMTSDLASPMLATSEKSSSESMSFLPAS